MRTGWDVGAPVVMVSGGGAVPTARPTAPCLGVGRLWGRVVPERAVRSERFQSLAIGVDLRVIDELINAPILLAAANI